MQAIDILKREHEVIERVLVLLESTVGLIRAGNAEEISTGFETWTVEFLRCFADGCHHGKEEDMLFPLLERHGVPRDGGPIGCMLHEHDLGRACVVQMAAALPENQNDPGAFATAAERYIPLLRQHIFKENNVLFVWAERCLSVEDDANLVGDFEALESNGGHHPHTSLLQELKRWEEIINGLGFPHNSLG